MQKNRAFIQSNGSLCEFFLMDALCLDQWNRLDCRPLSLGSQWQPSGHQPNQQPNRTITKYTFRLLCSLVVVYTHYRESVPGFDSDKWSNFPWHEEMQASYELRLTRFKNHQRTITTDSQRLIEDAGMSWHSQDNITTSYNPHCTKVNVSLDGHPRME